MNNKILIVDDEPKNMKLLKNNPETIDIPVLALSGLGMSEDNDNYQEKLELEVTKRTGQLKAALKKIEQASHETIYRLCRAAEFKDDNTAGHINRVSSYATLVAGKLGLRKKTTESILLAAPMHDVGKIGVPDYILQKPGKLTPKQGRGNHFDPDIVDAFFSITGQILEVKEKYTDDEINVTVKPKLFGN